MLCNYGFLFVNVLGHNIYNRNRLHCDEYKLDFPCGAMDHASPTAIESMHDPLPRRVLRRSDFFGDSLNEKNYGEISSEA